MKILWLRADLLHPAQSGAQIVSYEIARRLHQRHEIHFVAYERDYNSGGRTLANEYCSKLYPVAPPRPYHGWRPYVLELARAYASRHPFDARAIETRQMRRTISQLLSSERFDALFCDSLYVSVNVPDLKNWVLFNHNVEGILMARRAGAKAKPLVRRYLEIDARRTASLERRVCREAAHVIAISELDSASLRQMYGAERATPIHIGVSAERFARPESAAGSTETSRADLVFVGSMSWLSNVEGATWFTQEVLPRIRKRRPGCTLALVGQRPAKEVIELGERDPGIIVTGTVEDVRPWLWGGGVSIVPLLHGGGVRLKIFEAMAAGIPVVSTTIGAEGLDVTPGEHLLTADDPAAFAGACLQLLEDPERCARLSERAATLVREQYNWERTAREVESVLEQVAQRRSRPVSA